MCLIKKHKKYQYKYLLEKINQRWLQYHRYMSGYEYFSTNVSNQDWYKDDLNYLKQIEKRLLKLTKWLQKINKKYNYA